MFGGLRKKVKEELDRRSLEVDTFGYLGEHLEGYNLEGVSLFCGGSPFVHGQHPPF